MVENEFDSWLIQPIATRTSSLSQSRRYVRRHDPLGTQDKRFAARSAPATSAGNRDPSGQ